MQQTRNRLRVVLAQLDSVKLRTLSEAFSNTPDMEVIEIKDTLDAVWRQAIQLTPDIIVLYSSLFTEAEKNCLGRIVQNTTAQVILLLKIASCPLSDIPNERLTVMRMVRSGDHVMDFVEVITRVRTLGRQFGANSEAVVNSAVKPARMPQPSATVAAMRLSRRVIDGDIIAVGASTGGTEALAKMFHMLPAELPGIVVVQHMPPVFTQMYADRLDKELPFRVYEGSDNRLIEPGTIHIAPGDRHMMIKKRGSQFYTTLGNTEKVGGHCPAVNLLFESVAREAGRLATGIILTGMGADGAEGMLSMRRAGAFTIGQDESSCVVYGMPRKAFEFGAVIRQAALTDIPQHLMSHLMRKN